MIVPKSIKRHPSFEAGLFRKSPASWGANVTALTNSEFLPEHMQINNIFLIILK
jgi:hypothetical protein